MIGVKADVTQCEGYANCVIASPDVYDINDDGEVEVLQSAVSEDRRVEVAEAVRSCPTGALWLEEE